ncbi:ABC transporter permease [Pediococcus claussenii]|uniref:ABC transporter family protein n=1 Tax=Pediococcus claussenii (strain ATCC BAA-344 / DSM 14800 / JCM 18046 / KCTC 3811 / LMG 21948 / P06) TaxID=701521 RepID=G8PAX9_PEDCP|nr:ABC transporter permease [Pediococcus claussenii]AEV95847.1 ABC transporter family protein [Pediococcus claussenii ATCC BAA-344]
MTETIKVTDLQQGYGKTIVLKNINLKVNSGEILGLIGPSGAGKTTLVSTIMGMLKPKHGSVTVLGKTMPNRELLAKIGFMAQNDALYTTLTARENLTFFGAMKNDHMKFHKVSNDDKAKTVIREHNYDGYLKQDGDKLTLTLANSDQSKSTIIKQSLTGAEAKLKGEAAGMAIKTQSKAIKAQATALKAQAAVIEKLQKTMAAANPSAKSGAATGSTAMAKMPEMKAPKTNNTNYTVKTHYLYGSSNSTFFDTLLPIMIGFVVFFFVFLISGIALLRERTTGTLYRLLATPIKRGEIITGYLTGYGIFALVQTTLIVGYSFFVFKIQILGSIWNVFLINILLAFVALALGLFISTFAASEFQMVQFIPIVVIPQVFFSGIIPISSMAGWLQPIAKIFPLYYGAGAMSNVIEKGYTIGQIAPDLLALVIFAAIFLILNLTFMRRYRQV